jgi:hypothetical protein
MKTYILFLFANFDDFDDIEFFCLNVLGDSKIINRVIYIIQNLNNIIVILDSESEKNLLEEELRVLLNNENIHFYFVFEKNHMFMVHIPDNMKDIVFKPNSFKKDILPEVVFENFDLDSILDKIKNNGLDSITNEEKNFLDNFDL